MRAAMDQNSLFFFIIHGFLFSFFLNKGEGEGALYLPCFHTVEKSCGATVKCDNSDQIRGTNNISSSLRSHRLCRFNLDP